MDYLILILGQENNYLPGKMWAEYEVEVQNEQMVCRKKRSINCRNRCI